MLPRSIARLLTIAMFAFICAFATIPAPAAQAAGSTWQALATCTIRTTSVPSGNYLSVNNGTLITTSTASSQWQFYKSDGYYALKLVGTDTFITSTRQAGTAVILQAQNTLDPDSQLWFIKRTGSTYTFHNKKTGYYFFVMSGTVKQYLSSMTYFSLGASGSTCASYYTA